MSSLTHTELVVAHYNEPLNWLRRVPPSIGAVVYDKGGESDAESLLPKTRNAVEVLSLPNVGRQAHTYLWHIVNRYQTLAPLTIFCQARPFDHAFDFHHTLRALAETGNVEMGDEGFRPLGHIVDTDDAQGQRLFVEWSKNEDGRELDMRGFHRALLGDEGPLEYTFRLGAQFIVTAECIRRRPCSFYERALDISQQFPDAAHCFERAWPQVFGVPNPDLAWLDGRKTAYLKQVRRLSSPGEDKELRTTP